MLLGHVEPLRLAVDVGPGEGGPNLPITEHTLDCRQALDLSEVAPERRHRPYVAGPALVRDGGHGDPPAVSLLAQAVLRRYLHAVPEDLRRLGIAVGQDDGTGLHP